MNTVKAVIFIACIIGVITSMTDIATPEGTLKKQLRSVPAAEVHSVPSAVYSALSYKLLQKENI